MKLLVLASLVACAVGAPFAQYNAQGPFLPATTNVGGFQIWFPQNAAPGTVAPSFVFSPGAGGVPVQYQETFLLLASHGFIAWGGVSGAATGSQANLTAAVDLIRADPTNLPNGLRTDPQRIGIGGHSAGGPIATEVAAVRDEVVALIPQHAASIRFINRPSDATMNNLGTTMVMNTCGTFDTVPTCTCADQRTEYFNRVPGPRMLITTPTGHIDGAAGPEGRAAQGGYIVAFLELVLRSDAGAREALNEGLAGSDTLDDLDHKRYWTDFD